MSRQDRRAQMRELLAVRDRRGLTYRELAEESGVSEHALNWWAWKLRREQAEKQRFVELVPDPQPESLPARCALELEVPGGRVLRVPSDFDEQHLRRVLAVLATC